MNRSEVVRGIALKTSLTQAQARDAVDAFVDILRLAASDNDDITIAGFGKFTVREREPAVRKNPGTGEEVIVPRRKTLTFKASQQFRDTI
jgi:nucleoid DNA-binding protein